MGTYINSNTAQFDKSLISCGVIEMHHLPKGGSKQSSFQLATHLYHKANPRPAAFVMFSDVVSNGYEGAGRGLALAKELTSYGEVITTSQQINPRTGNIIQVWVFTPDHEKFRKYFQEELANRIETNS